MAGIAGKGSLPELLWTGGAGVPPGGRRGQEGMCLADIHVRQTALSDIFHSLWPTKGFSGDRQVATDTRRVRLIEEAFHRLMLEPENMSVKSCCRPF